MEWLTQCSLCESKQIETLCLENHFSRCRECGLIFDNPRPEWTEITAFYAKETQYDEWLSEKKARDDLWKRRLRLVRKYIPQGKLLDVGSGIGQFLFHAKKYFQVTGTEISPVAVKIARENYGVVLLQGTLESVPLESQYDVITLFHVLEHVPLPKKTLQECLKRLKPGGILVLAVPNDVDSVLTRRNRLMERRGFEKYKSLGKLGLPKLTLNGSEIHLSHFTAPVLSLKLNQLGFEIVDTALDPYFAVSGIRKVRRYLRFGIYSCLNWLLGKNLYDTIWIVAKKKIE